MASDETLPVGALDTDTVLVRNLRADDLDAMVRIDRAITGRSRRGYYEIKMKEALAAGTMRISLAAEDDGRLAGFMLGSLYYGEFGMPEPSAVLDTLAVDPDKRGRNIGKALLRQLVTNLRALGIEKIRTEVEWEQLELMGFLAARGFLPARRFCLDLDLKAPAADPSR